MYAAQTWRQLAAIFGEQDARALFALTNVLVVFGGSKDSTVQPRSRGPDRHRSRHPDQLADRHDGRPDRVRRRHRHPATGRDPPPPRTPSAGDRRERPADHRQPPPQHRRPHRPDSLPISSGSASSSPGAPPSVSILRIWRRSRWMKRGYAA